MFSIEKRLVGNILRGQSASATIEQIHAGTGITRANVQPGGRTEGVLDTTSM